MSILEQINNDIDSLLCQLDTKQLEQMYNILNDDSIGRQTKEVRLQQFLKNQNIKLSTFIFNLLKMSNFLNSFDISGYGLSAQRVRVNTISSNIANAQVTETSNGGPYKRKEVEFASVLNKSMIGGKSNNKMMLNGVKVKGVTESKLPPNMIHMPGHPQANKEGFVSMPNVSIAKEMVDMIAASRSYEANTSVIASFRKMGERALNIIRR